ncbi:type ISP restriction/modification enzyme [Sphingomonas koreensis]|uniref:type ISP restriction/modification enzyme n=1 Tax=Sphingomonas koreensis TaxID=93064 RepID=UPI00234F7F2E|nr:type ISP restriction/modification enzyme [Sphingomonas koreensis]MDC7812972.1 N-6 DNA methylase [Sphingomonas koreensis]
MDKVESKIEHYFRALRDVRSLGAGTKERSYYPAFAELLNGIGAELSPRVLCLSDLGNTGAGHPDFGLFAASQLQKGEPRRGQSPERGVIEMKGVGDDAWVTADTQQVTKYFGAYRSVLVTNLRDFIVIADGPGGMPVRLETFRLATSEKEFWELISEPTKSARRSGRTFFEFLRRALTQSVALHEPKDVAWFLASYARDALQRVEDAGDLPALHIVRESLEGALGVAFEAQKGDHFFRSTLVQTLFYGVFSAWVLWARQLPRPSERFDWHAAVWHLNVPFIRTLFQQIASPLHLQPLHLTEVLDWTAGTLNRVEIDTFFDKFNDAEAVPYFYEPFLEAFDPVLRKELGVWYTPTPVVEYMVARVDLALKSDLGLPDGLASENVYILDPCCGTGTFIAAVLRRISASLAEAGYGSMTGQLVKKAALERVFGFEIMPAPFIVAHLQAGLVLRSLGAVLQSEDERAGVYLTNALTGWEPVASKPLPFPELEEERRRADEVKQDAPILVILGNPPYNGFAGVAIEEERELSSAYKTTKAVQPPEGQGLNDLYVRFFRMAERRIVDKTGAGVVCFISNYSWLDGLSFTGMRERFLEVFDDIRVDVLNGDKYKTGKKTPEGNADPSIFSTPQNREGIQVGTAIATMVRRTDHVATSAIESRSLWGTAKLEKLIATADAAPPQIYEEITPSLPLGLPFIKTNLQIGYLDWPQITDLLPSYMSGVQTKRDQFLVDIDRDALLKRIADYYDNGLSYQNFAASYPEATQATKRYDPAKTRAELLKTGMLTANVVKYSYRPFDTRWVYWEPETKLLGEKSPDFFPNVFAGNFWIEAREKQTQEEFDRGALTSVLADNYGSGFSTFFPMYLAPDEPDGQPRINLSRSVAEYLQELELGHTTIFYHTLVMLHAPANRTENRSALRMGWPRLPVPADPNVLAVSASTGKLLASLLDTEADVASEIGGMTHPGLRTIAQPTRDDGGMIADNDLSVRAGWGNIQITRTGNQIVMPGRGKLVHRDYTPEERVGFEEEALAAGVDSEELFALLGSKTYDVYLSDEVFLKNVPEAVWAYSLSGYQVLKKWLSYRELGVLARPLSVSEMMFIPEAARRIAAILLLTPRLDASYLAAKANPLGWTEGRPVSPDRL